MKSTKELRKEFYELRKMVMGLIGDRNKLRDDVVGMLFPAIVQKIFAHNQVLTSKSQPTVMFEMACYDIFPFLTLGYHCPYCIHPYFSVSKAWYRVWILTFPSQRLGTESRSLLFRLKGLVQSLDPYFSVSKAWYRASILTFPSQRLGTESRSLNFRLKGLVQISMKIKCNRHKRQPPVTDAVDVLTR